MSKLHDVWFWQLENQKYFTSDLNPTTCPFAPNPNIWQPAEHTKPRLSSLTVCGPVGPLNAFIVHVESVFGAGWGFWQLLGVWYIFSEERLLATTRRRLNKHSDRDPHLAREGSLRKVTDSVDHGPRDREQDRGREWRRVAKKFTFSDPHWNKSVFTARLSQLGGRVEVYNICLCKFRKTDLLLMQLVWRFFRPCAAIGPSTSGMGGVCAGGWGGVRVLNPLLKVHISSAIAG